MTVQCSHFSVQVSLSVPFSCVIWTSSTTWIVSREVVAAELCIHTTLCAAVPWVSKCVYNSSDWSKALLKAAVKSFGIKDTSVWEREELGSLRQWDLGWSIWTLSSPVLCISDLAKCLWRPEATWEGNAAHNVVARPLKLYLRELQPIAVSRSATEMADLKTILWKETGDCSLKQGRWKTINLVLRKEMCLLSSWSFH